MKVSEPSVVHVPGEDLPRTTEDTTAPSHISNVWPASFSSSVQSLLLRQHLHNHPGVRGRLRQRANRRPGGEAGVNRGPAAGQPRLGRRWEQRRRLTEAEEKAFANKRAADLERN